MHTVAELETNVPAFLGKLWKLVDDGETDDLICWAPNGRSFFIRNTARFARELLPHYYKHNNMASFVRQLNMYGFHKKVSVDVGGLKCDRDEMEFAHQYFIKDHPYLLEHIKRKIASSKSQDAHPPIKTEVMNKVLSEVRSMRGRQEHLDTRLGAMKRENEALWRELAMLRRKHLKQQEIVNKLIHFLVTLVQPTRNRSRSVKRRYPLMIDAHQQDKQMKVGKLDTSPTGPVIHELDPSEHDNQEHDLDSDYIVADILDNQHPAIQSPVSIPDVFDDESTGTVHYVTQTLPSKSELHVLESANDVLQNNTIHKSKKKGRKNKVPIKIMIPPTCSGEEAREELLMLEMGQNDSEDQSTSKEKLLGQRLKHIPMKTVRSSKLAAMARNIDKMKQLEAEVDSDDMEDEPEAVTDSNSVNLDDIFIIPEVMTGHNENPANGNVNGAFENTKESNAPVMNDAINRADIANDASSSSQLKDWSLSCVNSSNASANDAVYRLEPKEEVGNHVVSVQSDLDQLRDTLLNEGYSIDANTLLGLFGSDDPMSFGIPVNPELNPSHEKEDEDQIDDLTHSAPSGQLMAYTPSTSLLDFDDDILLDTNNLNADGRNQTENDGNSYCNEESLDLDESKAHLLESLVSDNNSNPSPSSQKSILD